MQLGLKDRSQHIRACYALIFLGLLPRLLGVNYGIGTHPDERFIIQSALDLNWNEPIPPGFAYGTSVFYLLRLIGDSAAILRPELLSYNSLFIIGRYLSIAIFTATSLLLLRVSRQMFSSQKITLIALTLFVFNPFLIQQSRFYTADPLLTLFSLWFISEMLRVNYQDSLLSFLYSSLPLIALALAVAISVKITGVVLIFPLLITLFWRFRLTGILVLPWILILTIFLLFLISPYSFFAWEKYIRDNIEQINLGRGINVYPYTQQYLKTTPYLYHLTQLNFYTFGILPLLLSFLGGALSLFKFPRKACLTIPILYIVIFFLFLGGNAVKFPRYLLPIYPFLTLFAAFGVTLIPIKALWRKVLLALLITEGVIRGIFISGVPLTEHNYHRASRWLTDNAPRDSLFANPTWDDTLPFPTSGAYHELFYQKNLNLVELSIFQGEERESIQKLFESLEKADYLIFPTSRTFRSILQDPEYSPIRARFLNRLKMGHLGFELIKTFSAKYSPSLSPFGVFFDGDLGDESLTVYDQPKVFIWRKVGNPIVTIETLFNEDKTPPRTLLKKFLSLSLNETIAPDFFTTSRLIFLWLLQLEILGLIFYLLATFLPVSVRSLIARPVALFLFALVSFLIQWAFGFTLNETTGRVFFLLFVGAALIFALIRQQKVFLKPYLEGVFPYLLFFFITLILRSHTPEIFWGEKPMDSAFFRFFSREVAIPAMDPWANGIKTSYYYFGFYVYALLNKVGGNLNPSFTYNLTTCTTYTFTYLCMVALMRVILHRKNFAYLSALFVVVGANYSAFFLTFFSKQELNFDLFWSSTRSLQIHTFSEYPLWSFLFGDVHPHSLNYPILITILALGFFTYQYRAGRGAVLTLLSILLFISGGTNTWDLFTICGVVGAIFFLQPNIPIRYRFILLAGGAFISYLSIKFFLSGASSRESLPISIVNKEELMNLQHITNFFGLFILPLLFGPKGYLLHDYRRVPLLLSFFILIGVECFSLNDRMNTVFKFYLSVWIFLGCAWSIAWLEAIKAKHYSRHIFTLSGLVMLVSSISMIGIMVSGSKVTGHRPTLDGTNFLSISTPEFKPVIDYLNQSKSVTPLILAESNRPPYGGASRIAMHTGVPSFIGWEHHLSQRGIPLDEIHRRNNILSAIYQANSPKDAFELAHAEKITHIVVGELERMNFGGSNNKLPLERTSRFFSKVAGGDKISLYSLKNEF